jgi:hypothetical protein
MSSSLGVLRTVFAEASLVALAALSIIGCNSTPTVPVPPPEFCGVTAPDTEGISIVTCEDGETARNIALVYNDNWGQGVMQATEEDGSFVVEIEANSGDELLIQMKYGNTLSAETALTVPSHE